MTDESKVEPRPGADESKVIRAMGVMLEAMTAAGADTNEWRLTTGLRAVLDFAERGLREQIADRLEGHADQLRDDGPFRSGEVGLEYIHGIEAAAHQVRTGDS